MPVHAHRFVHHLAQAVDAADGAVFGEGVPGVEGEVVAKFVLLAAVEVLRGDLDGGDGLEGGDLLAPGHAGVFDGHVVLRVLHLHLEGEAGRYAVQRELLVQGVAQEVG